MLTPPKSTQQISPHGIREIRVIDFNVDHWFVFKKIISISICFFMEHELSTIRNIIHTKSCFDIFRAFRFLPLKSGVQKSPFL